VSYLLPHFNMYMETATGMCTHRLTTTSGFPFAHGKGLHGLKANSAVDTDGILYEEEQFSTHVSAHNRVFCYHTEHLQILYLAHWVQLCNTSS